MIHLDTDFLISALRPGSAADRHVREWLAGGEAIAVSVVSWAEFLCGPIGEDEVLLAARVVPDPIPLLAEDAGVAARLFNLAGRRRGSLNDCMIAAIALRAGAAVATINRDDFRRLGAAGLRLVDLATGQASPP